MSAPLTISDLLKGDVQLTSPPNIYFELQRIIEDPNKSLTDVGWVIEKDPALSMRLLRMVNSAFFGFAGKIASINHAVTLIGIKELQNLVLAMVIIERFSSMPGGMLSMYEFWSRSLRCALLSKALCEYRNNKHEVDAMFICGLLHDIGQLIFYRRIPVLAREVGLMIEATGIDEIRAEIKIIGFDHYQAGAELARLWKLPEIVSVTMAAHDDVDYTDTFAEAASIVRAASRLTKMGGDEQMANIPADELRQIIDKVNDQFDEIFNVFYPS